MEDIIIVFLSIDKAMLFLQLNLNLVRMPTESFYAQVLKIWYHFLNFPPLNKSDVLNENLFNNRYITIGDKSTGKEFAFFTRIKFK